MALERSFEDLALADLHPLAEKMSAQGWRCVQVLCTKTDTGVDMTYTFAKLEQLANYQIRNVQPTDEVASIQDLFLGAFPFENEAKDLFGVNVVGMVLDFAGEFYQLSMKEPMTILTPEAKERKDKEAKKAEAARKKQQEAAAANAEASDALTDEEIEAKVAGLPADKAEKLRAALKAKQAAAPAQPAKSEPAALTDEEIEAKVAGLPPEKAEKLRAALKAKQASAEASAQHEHKAPVALTNEEIEAKVAGLPPEKAEKLRAALKAKQAAAMKEGN